jgi:hypothetical protein
LVVEPGGQGSSKRKAMKNTKPVANGLRQNLLAPIVIGP